MIQRRQHRTWSAKLHRAAVAFAGLWLSVAMLSGAARAHARYFYCEAMGLLDFDPCAAADAGDAEYGDWNGDDRQSVEARPGDCCTSVTLAAIPEGTPRVASVLPHPIVTAILPMATALHALDARAPTLRLRRNELRERWRVPPRDAREARAQIMVFLT